jgi:phosphate:Na+ symporter
VALAHVLFKVCIVILALLALSQFVALIETTARSVPRQIANAHLILNVLAAVIFLPLLGPYRRGIERILPEGAGGAGKFRARYLDQRVLDTPVLALSHATREVLRMGEIVHSMYRDSMEVFRTDDDGLRRRIVEDDDKVDLLQESITPYLTRLSQEELTPDQSEREVALIKIVGELERVGDLVSKGLMVYARKKIKEGFYFSREGFREIAAYHAEVLDGLSLAIGVLTTFDESLARRLVGLRDPLRERFRELQAAHIARLCEGRKESLDTSTIHLDLLDEMGRVAFHVTNIGYIVLGRH